MISNSTRQAYSEIDTFLNLLNEEDRNKVPKKLRELFKREKDPKYIKDINPNVPIAKQHLKKETLSIIALLNLQYWCEGEIEKARLMAIYKENDNKYSRQLEEKLNFNNGIKGNSNLENNDIEKTDITVYEKESKFKKFINKILNFIHKN